VSLARIGTDAYEIRVVWNLPAGGITAELRFAETPSTDAAGNLGRTRTVT
jgi:hypothetical protein